MEREFGTEAGTPSVKVDVSGPESMATATHVAMRRARAIGGYVALDALRGRRFGTGTAGTGPGPGR